MNAFHILIPLALTGVIASHAQETSGGTSRLPTVEVTASPASAVDAQETPASVSRIEADQISETGIASMYDLPAAAPGLSLNRSVGRSFGDVYAIRGIANTEFFSAPAVALYVDDAPAGSAFAYPVDLLDVESITVWRGPQGDAFGRNAAAGVVEVTTQRPTDEFHAGLGAGYASFNTETYNALLSGPIVPQKLRLSIAGSYVSSDGFIDNPTRGDNADHSEDMNGRIYLGWTPSPEWDIGLTLTGGNYHDGVRLVPLGGTFDEVQSDVNQTADSTANGQALRISHILPNAVISSITTRREYTIDPLLLDLDLSPAPGNTALIRQGETFWSEELRLQSPPDAGTWRWRTGLFFADGRRDGDDTRAFVTEVAPGFYMPVSQRTVFQLDENNYAAFGQASYAGFGRLGVTLGARLDYTEKSIERTKTATPGYPVPAIDDEDSYFTAAPKATVDCRITDDLLVYVSSGLGFKPGGFSAYIDPPSSPAYDTEQDWCNEAGLKSTWLDQRLLANLALFYNRIHDYQVEQSLIGTTDLAIFNAPRATTRGGEVELAVKPRKDLTIMLSACYTDAELDEYADPATGADLSGNTPPYVPEFTAAWSVQHKLPCGFFSRIDHQIIGKTYFDAANSDGMTEDTARILGARIGYEKSDYSVCLFGRNLTDEEYYTRRVMVGVPAGVPAEPRTFGIMASVKY